MRRADYTSESAAASAWLARFVGPNRALEILSFGRVFNADEALAAGLVTAVAAAESFAESVANFVERLSSLAPLAVRGNKRALRDLEGRTLEEQLALEAQIQADCIRSADFREGLDAFQNKRRANFEGR